MGAGKGQTKRVSSSRRIVQAPPNRKYACIITDNSFKDLFANYRGLLVDSKKWNEYCHDNKISDENIATHYLPNIKPHDKLSVEQASYVMTELLHDVLSNNYLSEDYLNENYITNLGLEDYKRFVIKADIDFEMVDYNASNIHEDHYKIEDVYHLVDAKNNKIVSSMGIYSLSMINSFDTIMSKDYETMNGYNAAHPLQIVSTLINRATAAQRQWI